MQDLNKPTPAANSQEKLPWTTPQVVELDIKRINQQMDQQEMELMNLLATDENAFRLLTGSASDYRLKEDAQDFSGLELLDRLKVYNYAWKASGTREYGVMAHELQNELPYLVSGKKDEVDENGQPQIQRVNYSKLVPVLLRAMQEQQEMINELSEQVKALIQQTISVEK